MNDHDTTYYPTVRAQAKSEKKAYITVKINTDFLSEEDCSRIHHHSNSTLQACLTADQLARLDALLAEIT